MSDILEIKWGDKIYAYPARPKSNNKNEQGRYEEDLHFGAVETFNDYYRHRPGILNQEAGMSSAMAALPFIAKYYGIKDKNEITKEWVKHWSGVYLMNPIY
jgi:hypothetical protein